MTQLTALIIEDEPSYVDAVGSALNREGIGLETADDGRQGLIRFRETRPDVVLLDLMLPGLSGIDVLKRIRAESEVPVIVLSAKDAEADVVLALELGADDYLTKPFAFEELLARIRALTRRNDQPSGVVLEAGTLRLDLLARQTWRGEVLIELSNREFALLEYFIRHPNQVLSRSQIMFAVWEDDYEPASNVIDVYVLYLRRKLWPAGEPSPIVTARGAGYRFDPKLT